MTFIPYNLFFFHTFQILLLLDLPFFHILSWIVKRYGKREEKTKKIWKIRKKIVKR
jgi:hypothetical protein